MTPPLDTGTHRPKAQRVGPKRRVGVLMSLAASDRESQIRLAVFLQALQEAGWHVDQDPTVDIRWGNDDADQAREHAAALIALAPDVILASGSAAAGLLHQLTRTVPIVFVQVAEPSSLAAGTTGPDANVTGFASIEPGMSPRWLALLKEISPGVTRVLVIRDPTSGAGQGQWTAMAAAAPALGLELFPVGVQHADEIARAMTEIASKPNGGLVVTTSTRASAHRDVIVTQAALHRLPAVYPFRFYAESGGLMSYGADWNDQYRAAAGYVDRILKGEKPADLPVRTPSRYELAVNLRTARTLGLDVPASILGRVEHRIE